MKKPLMSAMTWVLNDGVKHTLPFGFGAATAALAVGSPGEVLRIEVPVVVPQAATDAGDLHRRLVHCRPLPDDRSREWVAGTGVDESGGCERREP
jgi:hypothetical protein